MVNILISFSRASSQHHLTSLHHNQSQIPGPITASLLPTMVFKSITPLAVLLLNSTASACMQFRARVIADGEIGGAIVDNGSTTRTINTNRNSPGQDGEYSFSCQSGFAAWLSNDLKTIAADGGNNYRFSVSNNGRNLATSGFC
jgi:hypothetical protein